MSRIANREVPLKEELWEIMPDGKPCLVGSKCLLCGEVVFPVLGICPNCQNENVEKIFIGPVGRIYSITVVMQQPPKWYKGPVPYAFGFVELPQGVRVETLFTGCDPERIEIGMEVELVIEKLSEDDQGNDVVTYKFRVGRRL